MIYTYIIIYIIIKKTVICCPGSCEHSSGQADCGERLFDAILTLSRAGFDPTQDAIETSRVLEASTKEARASHGKRKIEKEKR